MMLAESGLNSSSFEPE